MSYPTPDRRPGRIAANLGVSRAIARGLLAIEYERRTELLTELLARETARPELEPTAAH